MENTKVCPKCGRELPLECFGKHKRKKDGLQCWCKECFKQYYADNAERLKQYSIAYHTEHRDEHIEKMNQWRADNPEYMKQWYDTIEGYARILRSNNLRNDRKYGRIGANEDPLAPLEYYVWGIQQRDFYDGKQYHWSEMGFDRIDNTKPHTIDNIVPCSTKNNVRRGRKSFEEFVELMRKENEELELIL